MIPRERILSKLDSMLAGNDCDGAKRLLQYWLSEATATRDDHGALLMENELMGLCRKLGEEAQALDYADKALDRITRMGIGDTVGAATTYLNCATVCKAFGKAADAVPLFCKAREIYEAGLATDDDRLGGLYNNMALAFVDLKKFRKADELYRKALCVMQTEGREPEQAITFLNMATAAETEHGLFDAGTVIEELCEKAKACMEAVKDRTDGHYAFVCEKCATVFGYYGFEEYARELDTRARRIYERT